jgi:Asp/Glu/hydantoin racemase
MGSRLALIHTVSPLLEVFDRLVAEMLPGVRPIHILDEPLLERVRQRGHVTTEDSARLQTHVAIAEQIGADAVLVTCSAISPCVGDIREATGVPVVKIDEAMIDQAVATGASVGVVATNEATLEPTRLLLQGRADVAGKRLGIELVLVESALSALLGGDGALHDALVRAAVLELGHRVDVIVLAQASMARVLEVIPEAERRVPILSSPHLALEQVRRLLSDAHT